MLRLLWRSRSNPDYRQRIPERLGFVHKDNDKPIIWLHVVSVGEAIAAKPLIEALLEKYTEHRILVTTTTPTGSEQVKKFFSERVAQAYFPYDLPDAVNRFITRLQPEVLIVVETEIWPNLYAECAKKQIPLLLVNARLSKKSIKSYRRVMGLIGKALANVNAIAVRSESDAERFLQLGANQNQIRVLGNIKYDIQINRRQLEKSGVRKQQWGSERKVWVAASTHEGEDSVVLDSYINLVKQFPDLILVLVPRHPERFDAVYSLCKKLEKNGVRILRHSQVDTYENQDFNIILGDTMGIMQSWFALADVVFVGGSLVRTGGHNPLEAVLFGVPVVSGPHMYNFEDMLDELSESGLLTVCDDKEELEKRITTLLKNPSKQQLKSKADTVMQNHRGVTARLIQLVSECF